MVNYCNDSMKLAQAYVPFQQYGEVYRPDCALQKGTVFPQLYRPYTCGEYKSSLYEE